MPDGATSDRPPTARPTRIRWLIFVLACGTSGLLYLHRYSWSVIRPAFRRENPDLNDLAVGWLDSAFNAAYALGQVPGGLAGDRFGARGVLSILALAWSLALPGVAWTGGFWRLIGARAIFGLAQAGAYPVLNKMTRTWFPLAARTSVQGAVTAAGRVGAACAPLIVGTLLMGALGLSWQTTLVLLGAPGVVLAAGLWLVLRDSPGQHPWANPAERAVLAAEGGPAVPGQRAAWSADGAARFSLAMLLLYAFTSTFQDQFYVNLLPSFLQEGRGLDVATAGWFAPLPYLGGALGGIAGGILNDVLIRRWGNRRWARSSVAFTGKAMAALLVVLSMQAADGRLAMVVLLAARVFSDWSLSTQWGAITDMGGRAAATVFGVVNMVGMAGGFVAGPAFGLLKRHYGWDGVFAGVAAMCLLAALCWLFIDCTRRLVRD